VFTSEDELYSISEDTNCPYCRTAVTLTQAHLLQRHFRYAIFYKEEKKGNLHY